MGVSGGDLGGFFEPSIGAALVLGLGGPDVIGLSRQSIVTNPHQLDTIMLLKILDGDYHLSLFCC